MQHFNVNHESAKNFLETLWDFCSSQDLFGWEERIQVIHPMHWQVAAFVQLDPNIQTELWDLFANAIAVGTRNLYSDYQSLETQESLEDMLRQMQVLKLELPNLELFRFSKANEEHGWGFAFDSSSLRAKIKKGIQ
jgi:hypothetical protein